MFTSLVHLFIVTVTLSVWPIKNCCCPDDTSIATMIAWHGYTMQEPFFVHKALNKKEIPASHTIFFLHIFSNLIAWNYSGFSSFRRQETSSIVTPSGGGGGCLSMASHLLAFYQVSLHPLTPKIWWLILPSGCYTFPCQLVMRTWC